MGGLARACVAVAAFLVASGAGAVAGADAIETHPVREPLERIFRAAVPDGFAATGVTRADYLRLMADNVEFFRKHQDAAGAIIDPYTKGERQYSTPAFAAAAGLLVRESGRKDLVGPGGRALSCALTALVEGRAADKHPDFYIPMLVHAYRFLKDVVPPAQAAAWADQFRKIDHEKAYRADLRGMNWNVVSSCGELLRRKDGLVAEQRRADQMAYLERCLGGHLKTLTPLGLFEDPGSPMTYDAFSRLWLEDVYADGAYDGGVHAERIGAFLRTGGLSTLLLLSPTGEWASGGRSGLHTWADAQVVAICEMNAAYWKKQGRDDVAGAFKRAARLAFQSVARWQRPSGELWIVKNRAEPGKRLGYEHYSHPSQYNLLPMAMLAIAYARADESIAERPTPSEVGGYVFDARETFHKVAAAAGGYHVLIDTAADPHYNATGLQRVSRVGVPYSAISDSAAGERAYGPGDAPKAAITPGITWKVGRSAGNAGGEWMSLAKFSGGKAKLAVREAALKVQSSTGDRVAFRLDYDLGEGSGGGGRTVTERYRVTADGVEQVSSVTGDAAAYGAHVPVLVSDGAKETGATLSPAVVTVPLLGSVTTVEFDGGSVSGAPELTGPRVVTHNGYVCEAVVGAKSNTVKLTIRLRQQ